jgi:hypothetical protein
VGAARRSCDARIPLRGRGIHRAAAQDVAAAADHGPTADEADQRGPRAYRGSRGSTHADHGLTADHADQRGSRVYRGSRGSTRITGLPRITRITGLSQSGGGPIKSRISGDIDSGGSPDLRSPRTDPQHPRPSAVSWTAKSVRQPIRVFRVHPSSSSGQRQRPLHEWRLHNSGWMTADVNGGGPS